MANAKEPVVGSLTVTFFGTEAASTFFLLRNYVSLCSLAFFSRFL